MRPTGHSLPAYPLPGRHWDSCPSAADRASNPRRTGDGWTVGAVSVIPANPVHTGHIVENVQRSDRDRPDPGNTGLGERIAGYVGFDRTTLTSGLRSILS